MTLTFKAYSSRRGSLKRGAKVGIRNRLYVPGWELRFQLGAIVNNDETYSGQWKYIIIAYNNNVPIGLILNSDYTIQLFVRKLYRRLGVGSSMVKELNRVRRKDNKIPASVDFMAVNKSAIKFAEHLGMRDFTKELTLPKGYRARFYEFTI